MCTDPAVLFTIYTFSFLLTFVAFITYIFGGNFLLVLLRGLRIMIPLLKVQLCVLLQVHSTILIKL